MKAFHCRSPENLCDGRSDHRQNQQSGKRRFTSTNGAYLKLPEGTRNAITTDDKTEYDERLAWNGRNCCSAGRNWHWSDRPMYWVVVSAAAGAYAAEMPTRSVTGRLTIVDADCVSPSNLNRQLVAPHSTIGRPKAEVLRNGCATSIRRSHLTWSGNLSRTMRPTPCSTGERFDHVIDATDTPAPKVNLIKGALERGIPLVSSMGADKNRPYFNEIKDISKSHH